MVDMRLIFNTVLEEVDEIISVSRSGSLVIVKKYAEVSRCFQYASG